MAAQLKTAQASKQRLDEQTKALEDLKRSAAVSSEHAAAVEAQAKRTEPRQGAHCKAGEGAAGRAEQSRPGAAGAEGQAGSHHQCLECTAAAGQLGGDRRGGLEKGARCAARATEGCAVERCTSADVERDCCPAGGEGQADQGTAGPSCKPPPPPPPHHSRFHSPAQSALTWPPCLPCSLSRQLTPTSRS